MLLRPLSSARAHSDISAFSGLWQISDSVGSASNSSTSSDNLWNSLTAMACISICSECIIGRRNQDARIEFTGDNWRSFWRDHQLWLIIGQLTYGSVVDPSMLRCLRLQHTVFLHAFPCGFPGIFLKYSEEELPPLALHPKQNLDACTAGVILFLYCFCLEAE